MTTTDVATEMLDGLRAWSYTLETGSRVRALIDRTERAETALRHLWSSLALGHQSPHTPDCLVCKTHDEVRSVIGALNA